MSPGSGPRRLPRRGPRPGRPRSSWSSSCIAARVCTATRTTKPRCRLRPPPSASTRSLQTRAAFPCRCRSSLYEAPCLPAFPASLLSERGRRGHAALVQRRRGVEDARPERLAVARGGGGLEAADGPSRRGRAFDLQAVEAARAAPSVSGPDDGKHVRTMSIASSQSATGHTMHAAGRAPPRRCPPRTPRRARKPRGRTPAGRRPRRGGGAGPARDLPLPTAPVRNNEQDWGRIGAVTSAPPLLCAAMASRYFSAVSIDTAITRAIGDL